MVDESYSEHYSVNKLIEKVGKVSKSASSELLRAVVMLYVILQEPTVPTLTKAMIVAALGYFICPIDLIPDFLPFGFVDDLAILTTTLGKVYLYKNEQVREQVEEILPEWSK